MCPIAPGGILKIPRVVFWFDGFEECVIAR
jgi:hypothetical protein